MPRSRTPAVAPGDLLHQTVTSIASALGIGRQCAQEWKKAMGLTDGPYSELGWRLWARNRREANGGQGYDCPRPPSSAIAAQLDGTAEPAGAPSRKARIEEVELAREELGLARELKRLVLVEDLERVVDALGAMAAGAYIGLPDLVLAKLFPYSVEGEPLPALNAEAARAVLEQVVRDARGRIAAEARAILRRELAALGVPPGGGTGGGL